MTYVDPATAGTPVAGGTIGHVWGLDVQGDIQYFKAMMAPQVLALSSNSATPTFDTDTYNIINITAQTTAITSFTTNLTGTPVDGDTLRISITGTTSIALTWGSKFEASTVALPTTTSSTTRLDVGFFWNTATSKWRCVAVA